MQDNRIAREQDCVEKMIMIYCQAKHRDHTKICDDCQELLDYAVKRLQYCKFGEKKPVCAKCPIHCYLPRMKSKIIEVMRYSGPRMMTKHPKLAMLHFLDRFRPFDFGEG